MARKTPEERRKAAAARIAEVKRRILALDLVCSGALHKRTKVCGKPGCRCARDPAARHGPYHEWGRLRKGRLVHRVVPPKVAALLKAAIGNYRAIRRLLRSWEAESVKLIDLENEPK